MTSVGLTLQPENRFLDLLDEEVIPLADYFEVAPETLWYFDKQGNLAPNGFYRRILARAQELDRPLVAHGVGWSVGGSEPPNDPRRMVWRNGIAATHNDYQFLWYTDHFGVSRLAGQELILPLGMPHTDRHAQRVRDNLRVLQEIVPDVGVENTVVYFPLADPLDEPLFLRQALSAERTHLVLDLHNVFTMAQNLGFREEDYLENIPLEKVIEIHVSGGVDSDPAWLPDGATLRLDSHDDAVPEPVFAMLEEFAPRCPNLRGVTLERMEGTVERRDVPLLRDELLRARDIVGAIESRSLR